MDDFKQLYLTNTEVIGASSVKQITDAMLSEVMRVLRGHLYNAVGYWASHGRPTLTIARMAYEAGFSDDELLALVDAIRREQVVIRIYPYIDGDRHQLIETLDEHAPYVWTLPEWRVAFKTEGNAA